ncbi:hypothetical protein Ddc_06787 [Ditylenchus destructor]|nr:hypothetical protein Ddc_06787 [Ditylenchus destructor]
MRLQLIAALNVFLNFICCIGSKPEYGSIRKPSGEQKSYSRTSNKFENSFTATESSPLMPFRGQSASNNNIKCNNYQTTTNNYHYITRNPSKTQYTQSNELLSSLNEVPYESTGNSTYLPATTVPPEEISQAKIPNGKTTSYSMIVDMEPPVEALELDLVSSSSIDREMSGLSASQTKLDRTTSCGLAKKLEEFACTFIEAQDIAMNKAREQRTNLLDVLIRALSQNAPSEGEGGCGQLENIPLITEDPAPEDLAYLCHFESTSSCIPSPIIGNTIRRASLLSSATFNSRVTERNKMNKRTSIPDAQLASISNFLAQYHRRYSSASDRFANLEQSTSFQQWKDLKSRGATSSYAKITQAREMLRESLQVLLDEGSSSFLPDDLEEVMEDQNGKNESGSDEEEEVVFL